MSDKTQHIKFQVVENGFIYKNKNHQFDEIKHIYFLLIRTTQRMNFIKFDEADSSYMDLTLTNEEKIYLSFDEAGIFFGFNANKQEDINNLQELYFYLSERTFKNRLAQYLKQVEENGYFKYDKCYFYPHDKIVFRNKEFPIKSSQFLKGQGYISLRKKDFGVFDKVKQELSFGKIPQFSTCTDTDVIFTLLKHYFSLTWNI
jgi:hypothetical protein